MFIEHAHLPSLSLRRSEIFRGPSSTTEEVTIISLLKELRVIETGVL